LRSVWSSWTAPPFDAASDMVVDGLRPPIDADYALDQN
jgi:hypothetical protein